MEVKNGLLFNKNVLNGLNKQQKDAVMAPMSGVLQIVAGPGTGKTKVLVARVAKLLVIDGVSPDEIIVTTFTKKASLELKERLKEILKGFDIDINKLITGTFHGICFRILSKYGSRIGLRRFSVAGENDSEQILNEVLLGVAPGNTACYSAKEAEKYQMNSPIDETTRWNKKELKKDISKLKTSGACLDISSNKENKFLLQIYLRYQDLLSKNRLLDYDDCLLYCYKLLKGHSLLSFVKSVLVDEFQDTNQIQLELMYQFAKGHPDSTEYQNNVTIVGDPDQSIYAFRAAHSKNFQVMESHYRKVHNYEVKRVSLVENYRSTSDILDFSETLMSQDTLRKEKKLKSQSMISFPPTYCNFKSPHEEASWIASNIQFLSNLPARAVCYDEISILLRSSFQARCIEKELVKKGIPYAIHKGKAFWQRKDVLSLVDYLRVIANKNDKIALLRTLNIPKRGIGEKTIAVIDDILESKKVLEGNKSYFELLAEIVISSHKVNISQKANISLKNYVTVLSSCHQLLEEISVVCGESPETSQKLGHLFSYIYINSGLKDHYKDDESSGHNIQEVYCQLLEFKYEMEDFPAPKVKDEMDADVNERNMLELFILSLHLDDPTSESSKARESVKISTIHGAKGLEWPVVFIPGLSEGILPARFALEDGLQQSIDEERRCFYVATTRARSLMYISSYVEDEEAGTWGRPPIKEVSRFLVNANLKLNSDFSAFKEKRKVQDLYNLLKTGGFSLEDELFYNIQEMANSMLFSSDRLISFQQRSHVSERDCIKFTGFSKASTDIETCSSTKIHSESKSKCKVNVLESLSKRSARNLGFKPPALIKKNFAPSNLHKEISLKTDNSHTAANKAPTYIPTRKVPEFIKRRRAILAKKQEKLT